MYIYGWTEWQREYKKDDVAVHGYMIIQAGVGNIWKSS